MGRRKKEKANTVSFTGVVDFDIPHVFCVKCQNEREAHELKGFIDFWLKVQESKIRYEFYRISHFDDVVFLFHKSDELDLPDNVQFYTPMSVLTGEYVILKKEKVIHRKEEDFKDLYE